MSHTDSQFDPQIICASQLPQAPQVAIREAIIARANRLYMMGELALAAALLLEPPPCTCAIPVCLRQGRQLAPHADD
jgi:hypothetical protein